MLGEALELWQPLHDPEPERDDQNFKLDGKEYNYNATDTHRILVDLRAGLLTSYPFEDQEQLLSGRGLTFSNGAKSENSAPQYSETVNIEPIDGKLKILFLAANPDGKTRLKLDEELRNIQDRIREAKFRDRIEITTRSALRHGGLRLALLEEKPHIVHFSGHGSVHDELILQDDDGSSHPVPRAALVSLFNVLKDDIRLVVFNACFSRPQAEGIVENIAFAIGMNRAIGDKAAIQFAEALYQAIGFGRTMQEAFDLGTTALPMAGIPEGSTPELLAHPKADPTKVALLNLTKR